MSQSPSHARLQMAPSVQAAEGVAGSFSAHSRLWIALIIVAYLVVATLFAARIPAWQAPDEPAHYNYAHELATTGQFPVLRMGDYDEAYLEQLKSQRFPPELPIGPVRYEAHQPPLYYLLQAAIFTAVRGALLPMRLASVLLGAVLIWLVYEIARLVFAGRPAIWLGAAALVAFLPMHVATSASINNDALAEVLLAAILLLSIRYLKRSLVDGHRAHWLDALILGLLLGLALITKVSAYVGAPVALAAPLICWFESGRRSGAKARQTDGDREGLGGHRVEQGKGGSPVHRSASSQLLPSLLLIALPALLIAMPWYVRNAQVYGNLDILGRQWHDAVVVGQLRTGELLAQVGLAAVLERMTVWSFDSFWGVFGWMGVWMDARLYTLLLAWSLMALVGLAATAIWHLRCRSSYAGPATATPSVDSAIRAFRLWSLFLLALSALLTLAIYISYNALFVQPQGRYLFPALPAIAIAAALGWWRALRPAVTRWAGAVLLMAAVVALIWGATHGGINTWSLAILGGAGAAALGWSLVLPRLDLSWGRRVAVLAYALPYLALPVLDLVALQLFILPQLT